MAHILQSKTLIEGCTEFIIANIEKIGKEDVGDAWLAANASKNEDLMKACAPLVARNWEMFRESRLFHVNTEITGMVGLLGCPQMALVSGTSKVKALLTWTTSSRDDENRRARTNAFKNFIALLRIQNGRELLADLESEGLDIPVEWRKWLAEERGGTIQDILVACDFNRYPERLAEFKVESCLTFLRIFNAECTKVETELKLPHRECWSIVSFQNKVAFIGGVPGISIESAMNVCLSTVELMDPSTGELSSLTDMMRARGRPTSVATENEIFVFSDWNFDKNGAFNCEVYEAASGRWSSLPPMIEDRIRCAAVSIPDCGVLIIGGVGRNNNFLRSTELLTRFSGEGGRRRDEKWQWSQFSPMNNAHACPLFAIYFQGRVYAVSWEEKLDSMEMLDVAGRQWTSLSSFRPILNENLRVDSMAVVGSRLFVQQYVLDSSTVYSIGLESDPKRQHEKLRQMRKVENVKIVGSLTTVQLKT